MRNPILIREVLTSLRTRRAMAMQMAYLAVLIAIVFFNWPSDGLQGLGGDQAQGLLAVLGIGQLALIALLAPALTATSLTYEKERNTFESLLATRLSPWEITLGKMAGALAFPLVLVAMASPALASLFLLGGVTAGQVLGVGGLLALEAGMGQAEKPVRGNM